jgi:hypothetical protein
MDTDAVVVEICTDICYVLTTDVALQRGFPPSTPSPPLPPYLILVHHSVMGMRDVRWRDKAEVDQA